MHPGAAFDRNRSQPCRSTRSDSTTPRPRSTCGSGWRSRPDTLSDALRDLIGARRVKEAAILSTCHRTEVYFHGDDPQAVAHWLEGVQNLSRDALAPYMYTLPRDQAVTHAFRVASGLIPIVLGEPQDPGPDEAGGALGRGGGDRSASC